MRTLILFFFFLIVSPAFSQIFSGRIVDKEGLPVPDATIYIYELKSGISADNNGEFLTHLSPGRYNCEASSLGYKRERFSILIEGKDLNKVIQLQEIAYELKEVRLSARGDDRGNAIMRKAVAKAPYYRYQLKEYEAEAYIKGTIKVTRLPKIVAIQAKKKKVNLVLNKLFLIESQSEISYKAPDLYEQRIKAFSSTLPAEIDPGDYSILLKSSIYQPEILGMVSPLSPQALTYYKFVYQGIIDESGKVINKILIVPKKGDAKLLSGHLYIVDDTWNVCYAELVLSQSGIRSDIKVNYNEVKEGIFLPTGYTIDCKVDIFGAEGVGRYYSSITYKNFEENISQQFQKDGKIAKETQKIKIPGSTKSLEIKNSPSTTKVIVDSTAKERDSTYWLTVRKLPLREDEIKSYKSADSLKLEYKQIQREDSIKNQNRGKGGEKPVEQIFYGHKYKIGKKWYFSFGGLSKLVGDFNFVDGYQIGQIITFEYRADKEHSLTITPSAYYSTERERLLWQTDITGSYLPMRGGKFKFSAGSTSADISSDPGTNRFVNSLSSFLYGYSPVKLLSKEYLELSNSIEIANGLRGDFLISFQKRKYLNNGSVKSIFGKVPDPNFPQNTYLPPLTNHSALLFSAGVTYTPKYFYRVSKGRKKYVHSAYPTFMLKLTVAPGEEKQTSSRFASLELGANQSIKLNIYSKIKYSLSAGTFINKERLFLPDFKHFRANDIMLSEDDFDKNFLLLDNYTLSTPEGWVQGLINYNSEYILFKYLPFINTPLVNESLHLHTLWLTELGYHHTELGYSIGINDVARIGVFAGFRDFRYKSAGFRIAIPLLKSIR
ncbi:MAG: DUF5686 family protein [Rikenellaceae bacterium]